MSDFIQVMTTIEGREQAAKLAILLVEQRLAACAQILGPVTSYFHWDGKIDQAEEYLCIIKSRQVLFPELEKTIAANHPYEVPEIIATPISAGAVGYMDWLNKELKAP